MGNEGDLTNIIYVYGYIIYVYLYIFEAVIVPQLCKLQLFILSTNHSHCHELFFTVQNSKTEAKYNTTQTMQNHRI